MSSQSPVTVRRWSFDDPALPAFWTRLFKASDIQPLSQTFEWQRTWAEVYCPPTPLLLAAERDGETVALAPFYACEGMVQFLGVGEADRHDLLGQACDVDVMTALLAAARDLTPDFEGMKFHSVPETSRTGPVIEAAAERLGMAAYESGDLAAVHVDLAADRAAAERAVSGSMRKAEAFFRNRGDLQVLQLSTAAEVLPLLPEFFSLHQERWRAKGLVSDYEDPRARRFLTRWIEVSAERGWIRVIRLVWNAATLGIDFNWHHQATQYGGRWVFAPAHAARSPGKVLLRQAVLMAIEAGLETYDLGLGDQAYKFSLPSRRVNCITWSLYRAA